MHYGADGDALCFVARSFSAPWAAIDNYSAVRMFADHRVVVVQQFCAGDVFDPQLTVGAFAGAALAQEHIALAVVHHHRRVHLQRAFLCSGEGEEQHHGVVYGKQVAIVATGQLQLCLAEIVVHHHYSGNRPFRNRLNLKPIALALTVEGYHGEAVSFLGFENKIAGWPREGGDYLQIEDFVAFANLRYLERHQIRRFKRQPIYRKNEIRNAVIIRFISHTAKLATKNLICIFLLLKIISKFAVCRKKLKIQNIMHVKKEIYSQPTVEVLEVVLEEGILGASQENSSDDDYGENDLGEI